MTIERNRVPAPGPRREKDDLLSQVLGGLWPAEGCLEILLDRLEAREAVR